MGFFSEMDIDRQIMRKHAPPAGFSFRCLMEDLCNLCGFDARTERAFLLKLTEGYSCSSREFWDENATSHPMRSLSYAVRIYIEACEDQCEQDFLGSIADIKIAEKENHSEIRISEECAA
ncbi:MAG: hypothetical protein IJH64_04945 [Oscillospiraceae bacterium]|nr:hypothetical protein [Oscillospiraceae bacterium]